MELYAVGENSLQMKSNVTIFHLNLKWKFIVPLSFAHFCHSQQTSWQHTTSKLQRTFRHVFFFFSFFFVPSICNFKWDRNFCKPTLDAQHQPITVAQPVATRFAFVWMIYSTISIAANKRIQIKINIISFSRHTVPTRLPHIFYSFTLWTKLILE